MISTGIEATSSLATQPQSAIAKGDLKSPPVGIIVVLYANAAHFPKLWSMLCEQIGERWHLIAVDNGPTVANHSFLSQMDDDRISIIRNAANQGFARAANQGIRLAARLGFARVLLLNPDTELQPDFLAGLIQAWSESGADVVVPRIMRQEDPTKTWYAGGSLDSEWVFKNVHHEHRSDSPMTPQRVDFASGCCLGITTEIFRKVGLFDESLFVYWEDSDFCMRLKERDVPILYFPCICALHEGGGSSGGERSPAAQRLFFHSYALLLRKHFGLLLALRSMARITMREWSRPDSAKSRTIRNLLHMARGVIKPLWPVPKL